MRKCGIHCMGEDYDGDDDDDDVDDDHDMPNSCGQFYTKHQIGERFKKQIKRLNGLHELYESRRVRYRMQVPIVSQTQSCAL